MLYSNLRFLRFCNVQVGRQISIIDRTKEFIRDVNTSAMISYDVLEEFGSSLANELTGNARDAVRDYLQR